MVADKSSSSALLQSLHGHDEFEFLLADYTPLIGPFVS